MMFFDVGQEAWLLQFSPNEPDFTLDRAITKVPLSTGSCQTETHPSMVTTRQRDRQARFKGLDQFRHENGLVQGSASLSVQREIRYFYFQRFYKRINRQTFTKVKNKNKKNKTNIMMETQVKDPWCSQSPSSNPINNPGEELKIDVQLTSPK